MAWQPQWGCLIPGSIYPSQLATPRQGDMCLVYNGPLQQEAPFPLCRSQHVTRLEHPDAQQSYINTAQDGTARHARPPACWRL